MANDPPNDPAGADGRHEPGRHALGHPRAQPEPVLRTGRRDLRAGSVPKKTMETLALLLSPYTPHLAEEMWEMLGHKPSISKESWPKYDASKCVDDEVEIVIQINGKLRSKIMMPINSDKEAVLEAAKNDEKAKTWLDGKTVIKEIVVPNKLVNIVVK